MTSIIKEHNPVEYSVVQHDKLQYLSIQYPLMAWKADRYLFIIQCVTVNEYNKNRAKIGGEKGDCHRLRWVFQFCQNLHSFQQ